MAKHDPYFITARYVSECRCGAKIQKGDKVFWYPLGKKALCRECSEPAAAEFRAQVADERAEWYPETYGN